MPASINASMRAGAATVLLCVLALAVVYVSHSTAAPGVLLPHAAKAAAHARLVALARRDERKLSVAVDGSPRELRTLDPVAQTISLAEDER